jgi:hypothetical protein
MQVVFPASQTCNSKQTLPPVEVKVSRCLGPVFELFPSPERHSYAMSRYNVKSGETPTNPPPFAVLIANHMAIGRVGSETEQLSCSIFFFFLRKKEKSWVSPQGQGCYISH